MPIYAFECNDCGHRFDRLQKLSDPDPEVCPECNLPAVRRQLTAPAFRLAGNGWYETDFKRAGETRRNLAGEPASAAEGAGDKAAQPAEGGEKKEAPSPPSPERSAKTEPKAAGTGG